EVPGFKPDRSGLLGVGIDDKMRHLPSIKKAFRKFYGKGESPVRNTAGIDALRPRRTLATSLNRLQRRRHLCAVVQVPLSAPPGSQQFFEVVKWDGAVPVGSQTFVVNVSK
ncbi:hypothetical protein ACFL9T_21040, partial [Thermodesulfobacteriota bacterium]